MFYKGFYPPNAVRMHANKSKGIYTSVIVQPLNASDSPFPKPPNGATYELLPVTNPTRILIDRPCPR